MAGPPFRNQANAFAFKTITTLAFTISKKLQSQISFCFQKNFQFFNSKMVNAKKLLKLARKWKKLTELKRKRITMPPTNEATETSSCSTSAKAEKGHFVVYSADQKRFSLPLQYLNNEMMRELFNMAEQEFGLCSDEPLRLPCDEELMEYAITLIKQKANKDVEKALLTSIACSCSYFHLQHQSAFHQLPICSF